MNVIIRLQNLPWSANATDIRGFFKNLLIPEGGVHIIGGENGDAFIAFSTDEDARQAMQLSGGKIKEVQVSLQLSSRAEMQKVIEKARSATAAMSYMAKAPQISTPMSASVLSNQFAKKQEQQTVMAPQPPVISMSNFLAQSLQQQVQHVPQMSLTQQPAANLISAYQAMAPTEIPGLGGLGAGAIPMGLPTNVAYANYLAMLNPSGMNFMNHITQVNPASIANPLVNKDPRGRRSDSRDCDGYKRHRSPDRRSRSRSRDRESGTKHRKTRFSAPDEPKIVPNLSVLPPALIPSVASYNTPQQNVPAAIKSNVWENPPPQLFVNAPSFQSQNAAPPPTRHYQTENNSNSSTSAALGNIGTCVKIVNVDNDTHYSDLRKFFAGLAIGNNDIKFVTDQKGNRSGAVLIRFLSSDSKKKALTKSMWQLKSTQVVITSIGEEDFDRGTMGNSSSGPKNAGRVDKYEDRYDNRRNDDRYDDRRNDDRRNNRFRDRSNSRERENRNFNRHDGNNRQNPNFRDNRDNFRNDRNDRFDRNDRNFRNNRPEERQEKPKEYKPDESYTVLIVDDIPRTATESDIFATFPNIVNIVIEKFTAYARFTTHETAKMTLENRFLHYICNKRVFLEAGSDEQFNDLQKKYGKFDNPEIEQPNGNGNKEEANKKTNENNGNGANNFGSSVVNNFNDDTNHSTNSRDSRENADPRSRPFESRDPRQRNFNNNNNSNSNDSFNDRFNGQPQQANTIRTDCVIIKNMDPSSNIEDVEVFFKDLGIHQMRVHILLDKKGDPCGDCFVEFKFPNDSQRAISKNNSMMKNNRVTVMQIPREQVDAVLSSFSGGSNDNGNENDGNYNRMNRDWAPPSDFGRPGCVLQLSNLSYRATVEDILDVLREFNLHPDQLIRRFNDMGQPTGNACINFNSPQDADMALDKYNSVKVLGRPVWLRRV